MRGMQFHPAGSKRFSLLTSLREARGGQHDVQTSFQGPKKCGETPGTPVRTTTL